MVHTSVFNGHDQPLRERIISVSIYSGILTKRFHCPQDWKNLDLQIEVFRPPRDRDLQVDRAFNPPRNCKNYLDLQILAQRKSKEISEQINLAIMQRNPLRLFYPKLLLGHAHTMT